MTTREVNKKEKLGAIKVYDDSGDYFRLYWEDNTPASNWLANEIISGSYPEIPVASYRRLGLQESNSNKAIMETKNGDLYIIYKEFGKFYLTNKDNYDARVSNEREIVEFEDVSSLEDCIKAAEKYMKLKLVKVFKEKLYHSSLKESSKLPSKMVKDYEKRAEYERRHGGYVNIDTRYSTIEVVLSDGSEYFFQDWEADDLLDEVPDNIDAEDYILAIAQGW